MKINKKDLEKIKTYVYGFIMGVEKALELCEDVDDYENFSYWEEWADDIDLHIYYDKVTKRLAATICKTEDSTFITEDCFDIDIEYY
jgi:hypothetical protein